MEIINGLYYRENIVNLLAAEKLPVDDLPVSLENFFVARADNEVTGVVGIEIYEQSALLRSLAVHPAHRDKGIAGELMKQTEDLAVARGIKEMYLLTETAPGYFKRKGYTQITRNDVPAGVQQSSEFAHVCPQSAIVMKKTL